MGLIVWVDWNGDHYILCSSGCLDHYRNWISDPNYPFEKATFVEPGVSFGCTWCGGDLLNGVTWLTPQEEAHG